MGRSTEEETGLSEHRKYRKFTAKQKLEIVLASLRGDRSIASATWGYRRRAGSCSTSWISAAGPKSLTRTTRV
jgi:hypothetical protein